MQTRCVKRYEKISNIVPNREKAEAFVKAFNYSKHSEKLTEFIGHGAKYMIELEEKEQKYSIANHQKRLEKIMDNWDDILKIICEELPSSKCIENILDSIKLPHNFSGIGIDDELVCPAFCFTKDIRDKYVLSHLAWDLGITPEELFQ